MRNGMKRLAALSAAALLLAGCSGEKTEQEPDSGSLRSYEAQEYERARTRNRLKDTAGEFADMGRYRADDRGRVRGTDSGLSRQIAGEGRDMVRDAEENIRETGEKAKDNAEKIGRAAKRAADDTGRAIRDGLPQKDRP